jgi:hypothetical protein
MINVSQKPKEQIPKRIIIQQLKKEAPDFLGAIINLEIPDCDSRLRIPVIETEDKKVAADIQRNSLEEFIDERCFRANGCVITIAEFYDAFMGWLDPSDRLHWCSKQKVSAAMPDWVVKGRGNNTSAWCWGNISFTEPNDTVKMSMPLIAIGEKLVRKQ